ncbi:winged helix-turn-helix transcriptional regulator [Nonomuraea sp. NPDC049152]|uniref:winged helix-turn-helix transcriptional regulator n=1 Tax=Nonomuraea sp. NPDC049152 TaxID=3154350 RepID=UPI00340578D0
MTRELREQDVQCSIAQAASVVGDWWSLLIVREAARGHQRFEELLGELGISRKVLTERLRHLVEHGVLERRPYQSGPVRHEYPLTEVGWALAPVLIAMQDWGDRWLAGDGTLTGVAMPGSPEARRVHSLVGTRIPSPLELESTTGPVEVVDGPTVLFTYPATGVPSPLPPGWNEVPGAVGCTLENRLFKGMAPAFADDGIALRGVSTQRPDEQAVFAEMEEIPFPLLSDTELRLAAALRLPTFRSGQVVRLKRLILVVDELRTIRHAIFPVLDIPAAITEAHELARALTPS